MGITFWDSPYLIKVNTRCTYDESTFRISVDLANIIYTSNHHETEIPASYPWYMLHPPWSTWSTLNFNSISLGLDLC